MTTARGENLQVIDLPTPGIVELHGQRVPASYANFYIANTVVLLPTFRHPNDVVAQETLQKLFPTRRVVAVDAFGFNLWLGRVPLRHAAAGQRRKTRLISCDSPGPPGVLPAICIFLALGREMVRRAMK